MDFPFELMTELPAVALNVIVVMVFVGYLRVQLKTQREEMQEFHARLETVATRLNDVLLTNAQILSHLCELLRMRDRA